MKKLLLLSILTLIYYSSVKIANASQTHDMSESSRWNIRIDGAQANSFFGLTFKKFFYDIDSNGVKDLVVCAAFENSPNKSGSGACYLIYDSILESFTQKGSVLDLGDPSNYNLRFEGPISGSRLGYTTGAFATDLNGNGNPDLLLPASGAHIARPGAGAFYIILDDIIERYSGTGNTIDLSFDANFSIRYDGSSSVSNKNYISESFLIGADINVNGKDDIIVGSGHTGLEGRARSGSLYVIYDNLFSQYEGTGNIVDLENPENYNLVYYSAPGSYFSLFKDIEIEDLDGNDKPDIAVGAGYADNNSRTNSGSVYIINDSLIDDYSGKGNRIDLTNPSNFNIRIDGASASDYLSYSGLTVSDVDNNQTNDVIISAHATNYNSRASSGSVYVLLDSLLNKYSETGNVIDLANMDNFNLRFDGAFANSILGYGMPQMNDFNGNGKTDIILTAANDSHNLRARSGSTYIVYDSLLSNYLNGSGNVVDLFDSSKYNLRYDGKAASDYFGFSSGSGDYDGDGTLDLLIAATYADPPGRSNAGSIYIIYNFPHTITTKSTLGKGQTEAVVTGKIEVQESITSLTGAQWSFSDNPSETWNDCELTDGSFDSLKKTFKCHVDGIDSGENIFFRARDENESHTSRLNYSSIQVNN